MEGSSVVAAPAVAAPVAHAVFCGLQLRRVARAPWCGVSGAVGDGVCVGRQRSRDNAMTTVRGTQYIAVHRMAVA